MFFNLTNMHAVLVSSLHINLILNAYFLWNSLAYTQVSFK